LVSAIAIILRTRADAFSAIVVAETGRISICLGLDDRVQFFKARNRISNEGNSDTN